MLDAIAAAVRAEFADLDGVQEWTRLAIRLALSLVLGAAIGWEREQKNSTAGLRTHMLVSLGCALFVLVPQQAGMAIGDLSRVIQGVIAGIGFLGIGAIVKKGDDTGVRGLTTAAGIWATAAIGITVGLGHEATAIVSTVVVLAILSLLLRIEKRFGTDGGRPEAGRPGADGGAEHPASEDRATESKARSGG